MNGSAAGCRAAVEAALTSARRVRMWTLEPSSQEHGLSPRGQGARQEKRPRVTCSNSVERNEGWIWWKAGQLEELPFYI